VLNLHTPPYHPGVVLSETWSYLYLVWSVFVLTSRVVYSTNWCLNSRRWITILNTVLVHRQQWQNVVPSGEEWPCVHCLCTLLSETSVSSDWTCVLYYTLCYGCCFMHWLLYNTDHCCNFSVLVLCLLWRKCRQQQWSILITWTKLWRTYSIYFMWPQLCTMEIVVSTARTFNVVNGFECVIVPVILF
jgi:hypothetical protein